MLFSALIYRHIFSLFIHRAAAMDDAPMMIWKSNTTRGDNSDDDGSPNDDAGG